MKEVTLDLHGGESQLRAVEEDGRVLLGVQVPTTVEDLRRVVAGIPGPKRVIFADINVVRGGPALPGGGAAIRDRARRPQGRGRRDHLGGPDRERPGLEVRELLGRESDNNVVVEVRQRRAAGGSGEGLEAGPAASQVGALHRGQGGREREERHREAALDRDVRK